MPEIANGKNESFLKRHQKARIIILALLINSIFLCASCKTWDSTSVNTASSSGSNLLRAIVNYAFVLPENKETNKTAKQQSPAGTTTENNTIKTEATPKNDVSAYNSIDPEKDKSTVNTYAVKKASENSKSDEPQKDKIIVWFKTPKEKEFSFSANQPGL